MRSAVLVVPGSLGTRTGGYIYDRRIVEGLRARGWAVAIVELGASFPYPTPPALEHAARALGAIPAGRVVLVDSLAFGAMPDVIVREARRLLIVALVHLPLAADPALDEDTTARFEAAEHRAFGAATLIVVTGAAALPLLERYCMPRHRIVVVEPGTDRAPLARGSGGGALTILTVATLHPGKGYDVLLTALSTIRELDWQLICAGSLTRHPSTADAVRALIQSLGMEGRVSLVGDLDQKALAGCYDEADLFVSASLRETYGMAIAEALARGLPVIATRTGAGPALVGDAAGILVPPGDAPALAEALARAVGDSALRARFAEGARHVRERLPDWSQASARMAAILESITTYG